MAYGTVSADLIQTSTGQSLGAGNSVSMVNRIINSRMEIDQRNAGASVTPANGEYTLDRFVAFVSQSSKFSVQQNAGAVTPPVGFTNYLGCTSLSAYTVDAAERFVIRQQVEGFNVADLGWGTANAKTVTLSFWVYSSLTGTFGGSLKNGANDRSYPYSYTISVADTWEQKSVTIEGETTGTWLTTNGIGVRVQFSLGAGASDSGTAGAWASSNFNSATGATSVVGTDGATFYITGVDLRLGEYATAPSPDFRSYQQELALCQRYYWRNTGALYAMHGAGTVFSATLADIYVKLAVSMRTAPTISISATQIQVGGSNFVPSGISGASGITNDVAFARLTSSGMTTGQAAILTSNNNSAGYFDASSEL